MPRRRTHVSLLAAGTGCVFVLLGVGCQKSLFTDKGPRNQFVTYDQMRQRYVPMEEPDVFGNPQPALRARLSRAR